MRVPSTPRSSRQTAQSPAARVVCISTEVSAAESLRRTVAAILPLALVETADTSVVRDVPEADCVILAVGAMYSAAGSLVRELRATGYARSVIVVVEARAGVSETELATFGVGAVLEQTTLALQLPGALLSVLTLDQAGKQSPQAAALLMSLRRMQTVLAAGELASQLQHRLNNPLAALLAEAQLLEMEPMREDHATAVRRIVELCRRVIEVSRSIGSIGGSTAG